jgi:hypothetical protein
MSYLNLPPGRNRGIAYYNFLISRARNRNLRAQLSPILYRRRNIPIQSQIREEIQEYINIIPSPLSISSFILRNNNLSYNVLSDLENVKIGLSLSSLIKNSEIKVLKDDIKDDLTCVICQDNFEKFDVIRKLNCCSKEFHINCIDKWFSENKKCPLCNFSFI